jgi:hypothetical protein
LKKNQMEQERLKEGQERPKERQARAELGAEAAGIGTERLKGRKNDRIG